MHNILCDFVKFDKLFAQYIVHVKFDKLLTYAQYIV